MIWNPVTWNGASAVAMVTALVALAGLVQALAGLLAVHRFAAATAACPDSRVRPPITVLKPLHGDEPMLEAALASFCAQDYPAVQIVFGVQDRQDAAIAVVDRLRARFPAADIELVVDATPHGVNRKVANLVNMFPSARHDLLVISDSDMHAPPGYLASVADALAAPGTGLVTTLYTGLPAGGRLAGMLGAAYINQTFAAGALMARLLGRQDCMGATMALTRETLMRVGGLPALSPYVADDAVLGMKVRALGRLVTLAASVPATTVAEPDLAALFRHELRWARTIRAVEPLGFAVSVIQFPGFWALLTIALSGAAAWAWALLAASAIVRAACGRGVERAIGAVRTPIWLPVARDVLSVAVLAAAYAGDEVAWRGHILHTEEDTHYATPRPTLAPGKG